MEIGDSGTIFQIEGPQSTPIYIFDFLVPCKLVIELVAGKLMISMQIRDQNGDLVAELVRNEWKVAPPPRTFDRNYTSDALEVRNAQGNIVLQVRVLPDRIRLQGEWWKDSVNGIRLVANPAPSVVSEK